MKPDMFTIMRKCMLLTAMTALAAISAFSYDFKCDGIPYSIIDREARTCRTVRFSSIEDIISVPKNLVIPSVVSDGKTEYTVTEIGRDSFSGYGIVSVTIPETVTKIGPRAFSNSSLQNATLPESLVEIGDSAFYYYNWRVNYDSPHHVRIPDGVRKIGKAAFMCDNYRGTHLTPANIPAALTEIEDFCFYRNAPEDLEWPKVSALTKIGRYAFYYTPIKEVSIPASVSSIGEYAFSNLWKLGNVSLPPALREMGSGAFKDCYRLTSVNIPEGVTVIGQGAFMKSSYEDMLLSSVRIPSTVRNIGDSAFYRCNRLATANLPDGLERLGKYAFADCSLESVQLPESIDSINDGVFMGNETLVSVRIPNSVTHIGEYAFCGCGLKELQLPTSLRFIGKYAFNGCDITSVLIPKGVSHIGSYAFKDCSRLTEVTIPDELTEINICLFQGCSSLCSLSTHSSPHISKNGNITIPERIETIRESAFSGCHSIHSVYIPATVKHLYDNPFPDCENLKEFAIDRENTNYKVTDYAILTADGDTLVAFPTARGGHYDIPSSVKTIGDNAFYRNAGLESINIPEGVLHIESSAFAQCKKYHDPVLPATVVSIDRWAFECIPFKKLVLPPSLRKIIWAFGNSDDKDSPEIESIYIYGFFDNVEWPIQDWDNVESIYYITTYVQGDNDRYFNDDEINWGWFFDEKKTILYVLEEVYDEIRNGDYWPWSRFEDIRIYDPTGDPYYASVQQVDDDIDTNLPLSVFNLGGVRVADSTEGLPSGIYIIRQGAKAKKIAVN